jgi:hypothetical protein
VFPPQLTGDTSTIAISVAAKYASRRSGDVGRRHPTTPSGTSTAAAEASDNPRATAGASNHGSTDGLVVMP